MYTVDNSHAPLWVQHFNGPDLVFEYAKVQLVGFSSPTERPTVIAHKALMCLSDGPHIRRAIGEAILAYTGTGVRNLHHSPIVWGDNDGALAVTAWLDDKGADRPVTCLFRVWGVPPKPAAVRLEPQENE